MSNIQTLLRKATTRMDSLKQRRLAREADAFFEAWATEGLLRSFQLIGPDGTLPADFDKRMEAIDREMEKALTEDEQAMIALCEVRYGAELDTVKEELLARLQSN
jgi:hypothetical protein